MDKHIVQQLRGVLGEEQVLTDRVDLIVMARTIEEVQAIVRIAAKNDIPIYPRGTVTNLSGGAIAPEKGIVLSLQRMNRILEMDPENLTATVEPGVVIQQLNNAAARFGLMYPHDPGAVNAATVGGSVAENAGLTEHHVRGMEVVLADGSRVRFGGKRKNVTSYDFSNLFAGSEGTLGIIVEITCKLLPAPRYRRTMLASFTAVEDAGDTVAGITKAQVIPATLEIMDRTAITSIENFAHIGLPVDAEALLLIEVDGMVETVVEQEAAAVLRVVAQNHGALRIAESASDRDQLWAPHRAALPALASLNNMVVLEDARVPRSKVTEMLIACREIGRRHNLTLGTFGDAGAGNLHPTILADKNNPEELSRVHAALDEIFETALRFGGTLSGEHGIGVANMRYVDNEIGESGLEMMARIKDALDPAHILNPGKLVPAKRDQSVGV